LSRHRHKSRIAYQILDVDLMQPLAEIRLDPADAGVALVVRSGRRPVGFVMEAAAPAQVLSTDDIHRIIGRVTKLDAVRIAVNPPPAPMRNASVTVAVCTRDNSTELVTCLDAIVRAAAPDAGVEVLVVDNAPSDDRTLGVVRRFPGVRYVLEPYPGLNFARNRALREATGEIIAFVDDDACIDDGWLAALREVEALYPEAAAFTGLVLPAELSTGAQVLFEERGGFQKHFSRTVFGTDAPRLKHYPCIGGKYGTGCNMAFRRSAILALGGFDEALDAGAPLPGGGDTDMFYRVVRAGHSLVYEPALLVFHRHRRDYAALKRQFSRSWGQGLMAFVAKTYRVDPGQRRNLRGLVGSWFFWTLCDLARSVAGRHPVPPGMLLGELWGAIVGLTVAYPRSVRRTTAIRRNGSTPPFSYTAEAPHESGSSGRPASA
jgi:GT2 family glycosyltransferase